MNAETIKKIFQSPFNYPIYSREIVHSLFGCNDVLTQPELIDTSSLGDSSHYVGQMEDSEGRLLGFFYTRVAEGSDVRRKRVGLRKLIQPYLRYEVDAAIAVFDDGQHWRLSYICDHKEGTTSAKRFSYVLGDKQGQYKTPLERLDKVAAKAGHFKMDDLRDAFSVDALSKEFFDEYHRHYDRILKTTVELISKDPTLYSGLSKLFADYIKKMMGRIVFLHFLQKKGWLNGDPEFLKNLFFMQPLDRRADFLEQVLEPLFFGIFNTEPQNREKLFRDEGWDVQLLEQWKGLPYLNGGLFERDMMDTAKLKLPATLFERLFEFMASYNFTVDENDPDDADIGVDPEMLGKIFESLLEDNKAKGAFYTPKEIVRYMCKESLIAYLETKLSDNASEMLDSKQSIRTFVEHHELPEELEPYREVLDTALREVKICDPAIGSGAFPMGLLNELWRCREAIENVPDELDLAYRAELKKEIIENNIYGVDIEKGAIDIARLRFWLSIVVDAEKPEPLPNFDYKFMQGNSLIESYKGFDLSRISNRLPGGQSKSIQLLIGLDSDHSRKNLQRLMRDYFFVTDHKQKDSMRQAINDAVKQLITDFIGGTNDELKSLNPSANKDFFLWHTWFKDIFDKGGFDIVIGNPPYIQLQTDGGKLGDMYKNCGYITYARTGDIYSLFYEQGWNLLCKGGHLCFITSNKWMRAVYGEKTREFFTTKTDPKILVDLGANVFENATVDTNILLYSKFTNQGKTISVTFIGNSLEILSDYVQQQGTICQFKGCDSWVILSPLEQSIKRKIEAIGTPLKDWDIQINYGIKTGCNDAFIISTEKREEILANCRDEDERTRTAELIQPILRGRDIKRYSYNWANLWLINTHNGVKGKYPRININDYPAVKQHLDNYWDAISSRADKGDTPYNLRNCAYLEEFSKIKLVWTAVNSEYRFCLVPPQMAVNNALFMITGNKLYTIISVFNSKLLCFYLHLITGDNYQFGSKELFEKIPIPINEGKETMFKTLIEINNSNSRYREQEINQQVYALYNLTPEEIAIIENS